MSNVQLEPVARAPETRRFDFRILITGALIAVLCGMFWIGSRYPSLQGKASADPNEALSTPLGFERYFPEPSRDQWVRHLWWTSVEWALTNRQGMTFGLLLAAGMLTILPLLRRARGGKLAGAIQGMLVGTPMGVCVNCAAPIAQGMLKGGSRVEIALATLFSSPSFNVIVLGIVLAIFPWYLAALKILAGVVMVLIGAPWLARLAERPGWTRPAPAVAKLPGVGWFQRLESFLGAPSLGEGAGTVQPKGFFRALGWVLLHYPRNLWRVTLIALPLMLLAGFLGAVMVEILPWDMLTRISHVHGWLPFTGLLIVATAFGVLLPVPIAFDVIVCSVLLNSGLPVPIVAALLATLGIYSIYAWSLLGATLSWKVATAAAAAVFVVGLGVGGAAAVLENWHDIGQARETAQLAALAAPAPSRPALPIGLSGAELRGMARPLPAAQRKMSAANAELWYAPFETGGAQGAKFTRIDGATLGFKRLPLPRPYQTMQPGPMHFSSLAAGDYNGDGWPDVAAGTSQGVFLYANIGGKFALQQVDFPAMRDWIVCDVALVDLDGDGTLDLYFSAWKHGGHVLFNRGGEFSSAAHAELPGSGEMCAASTAFADVDGDGLLDVVTGAATFESWFFYPAPAINRLWHNEGGRFTAEALPGPEGDTLSLLFTDLDGDGKPDLLVGNDFDEPDRVFLNRGGHLRPVTRKESPLPYSAMTTMSFDTADIDNDGKAELYVGQIAMGRMNDLPRRLAPPVRSCGVYTEVADLARCDALARFQAAVTRGRDTWSIELCKELTDPVEQRDCAVAAHYWTRILLRLPATGADKATVLAECEKIPADFTTLHDVCTAMADSPIDGNSSHKVFTDEIPSVGHANLLFARDAKGSFREVTKQWGVGYGGWTWNAKFADLDNDGWQDLFVAQGTRLRLYNPSNVYYRNKGGAAFEEQTKEAGFEDHLPTAASLFVDYDLDGRVDVITYPFQLTPVVFRNDGKAGPAFEVRLEDQRTPNRFAVGGRVDLRAADGRRQMREIKASGGNQSHDVLVARFGLGDWGKVASMTVRWPDGEQAELNGPFEPGRYRVVRPARPQPVAGTAKAD